MEGSASALLQPVLLHMRMQCRGSSLGPLTLEQHTHMHPSDTPSTKGDLHAEAHHTKSRVTTPKISAGTGFALLMACVPCQGSQLRKEQHTTPSPAQHARGLTSLPSPLLQATSPAIASTLQSESGPAELLLDTPAAPRSPQLTASPASYARSALSGLTVSRSKATAAMWLCPDGPCAGLRCALEGLQVPLHCQCSSPHWLPAICALPLIWQPERLAQHGSLLR